MSQVFKGKHTKRFLRWLLIFLAAGFLLAGGYAIQGQRVFFCVYHGDVVSYAKGYLETDTHYTYTGDEDSYLLIQCMEGTRMLLLKFAEDAAEDLPVKVILQDRSSQVLAEETITWEKGTCFIEVPAEAENTAQIELYVPGDFTVERAMFSMPFLRRRRAAMLYAGVVALAFLLSLVFVWRGWDRKLEKHVKHGLQRIRDSLKKENRKTALPVWLSFILILAAGSLYAWLEPAMLGFAPDEQHHYREVSEMGHPFGDGISLSDYDEYIAVTSIHVPDNIYTKEGRAQYGRYLNAIDKKGYEIGVEWHKPSLSLQAAYIPYVLVYAVSRTLHIPWTVRLMLGRWSMVWLFAFLCAAGIRHLKSGRLLVLMLGITPAVIFLCANYSYDTWITGWYIYGLCVLFGELQRPDELLGKPNAARIWIALFLADLPKLIYFPINVIAFFMPSRKFSGKKTYWLYKLSIVLQVVLLLGILYIRTFAGGIGTGDTRGGDTVNAAVQLQMGLAEPARFAGVILRALKDFGNPFYSVRGWGNLLGYMGYLHIGILIMILLLASIVFSWSRKEEGRFPWWYRLGVAAVYIGTSVLILVSMYITFTPVGADFVQGAQHRYLTPLFFPLFFVLTRMSGGRLLTGRKVHIGSHLVLPAVMMGLNVYAIWSLCLVYY